MELKNRRSLQHQAISGQQDGYASSKGKPIDDFDAYLASLPRIDDATASEAFDCAIAGERGRRRQLASEQQG